MDVIFLGVYDIIVMICKVVRAVGIGIVIASLIDYFSKNDKNKFKSGTLLGVFIYLVADVLVYVFYCTSFDFLTVDYGTSMYRRLIIEIILCTIIWTIMMKCKEKREEGENKINK